VALFSSVLAKSQPDWAANTVVAGLHSMTVLKVGGTRRTQAIFWMQVSTDYFTWISRSYDSLVAFTRKAFKLQSS